MRFNKFLIALFALPMSLGAINGKCSSGNGVCVTKSSCTSAGGTYYNNLCPNDPANVKCCRKNVCRPSGTSKTGVCKFASQCNGDVYSGVCPGGSNFKCCVPKSTTPVNPGSGTGAKVVAEAKKYLGNRYVYGGNSLTNGIDCSGFTQQIYAKFGVSLPRTSKAQSTTGKSVSRANAKAGDLFFYCSGGPVHHVAIYEGNSRIVHAANERRGIVEDNADYETPCAIRRVL